MTHVSGSLPRDPPRTHEKGDARKSSGFKNETWNRGWKSGRARSPGLTFRRKMKVRYCRKKILSENCFTVLETRLDPHLVACKLLFLARGLNEVTFTVSVCRWSEANEFASLERNYFLKGAVMLSLAVVCFVLSLRNLALKIKHNHSLIFSHKIHFHHFCVGSLFLQEKHKSENWLRPRFRGENSALKKTKMKTHFWLMFLFSLLDPLTSPRRKESWKIKWFLN